VQQERIFITKKGFVVIWATSYLLALLSPQLKILRGNSDFFDKHTAARLLLSGQGEDLAVSLFVVGLAGLLDYLKLLREMSGWVFMG
jgi:hypothetical protein